MRNFIAGIYLIFVSNIFAAVFLTSSAQAQTMGGVAIVDGSHDRLFLQCRDGFEQKRVCAKSYRSTSLLQMNPLIAFCDPPNYRVNIDYCKKVSLVRTDKSGNLLAVADTDQSNFGIIVVYYDSYRSAVRQTVFGGLAHIPKALVESVHQLRGGHLLDFLGNQKFIDSTAPVSKAYADKFFERVSAHGQDYSEY